jgi:hypothetical protein
MAKTFEHPSTLHNLGKANSVISVHGLKGYGFLMVILEKISSSKESVMRLDTGLMEKTCMETGLDVEESHSIVLTGVKLGILSYEGTGLTSPLVKSKKKPVGIEIISDPDLFKKFCEEEIFPDFDRFGKETPKSLEVERKRFLEYCKSKGKRYKMNDVAFKNWLESPYRKPIGQLNEGSSISRPRIG